MEIYYRLTKREHKDEEEEREDKEKDSVEKSDESEPRDNRQVRWKAKGKEKEDNSLFNEQNYSNEKEATGLTPSPTTPKNSSSPELSRNNEEQVAMRGTGTPRGLGLELVDFEIRGKGGKSEKLRADFKGRIADATASADGVIKKLKIEISPKDLKQAIKLIVALRDQNKLQEQSDQYVNSVSKY